MEAATIHARERRHHAPAPAARLARGLYGPVRSLIIEAGQFAAFSGRVLLECRGVFHYMAEILRQASIVVVGSALVIWMMQFVVGLECGIEGNYILRGYGATVYSGVVTSWCAVREMSPYMFGYIVAAKIGCGLVAEIGSMRINEEIDALESSGLNPYRYLLATRLVACWIAFPMIYLVGLGVHFIADYVIIVVQIGEASRGGWETVHWSFMDPRDIVYSLTKVMMMGTSIVLVGLFYGFTASGGPVGVGTATARSMIINLILIHVIGSVMTMVFWGLSPNAPVGG